MNTTHDNVETTQDPTLQELTAEEQSCIQGGYGIYIRRMAYVG